MRGAVGEVEVGHAVEQGVEEVGGVGVVDRAKELERQGAAFKENLRGLRQSRWLRWFYGWCVALVWLVWPGLVGCPRFTLRLFRRLSLLLLHSLYMLSIAVVDRADLNISALGVLGKSRQ